MENIVLTAHLIIALALIAVVLMQRSEGGIGLGGGGNHRAEIHVIARRIGDYRRTSGSRGARAAGNSAGTAWGRCPRRAAPGRVNPAITQAGQHAVALA